MQEAIVNFRKECIVFADSCYDAASSYFAKNKNICWIIGFAMVVASLWMRSQLYLGTDAAFYYLTAEKILDGQRYYYDFFESNFPLNFYIFTIPVIFHRITGIAPLPSFYFFITGISLVSIYFSSLVLKKTNIYKDGVLYQLFILGVFVGFFFPIPTFPHNEIGTKTLLFIAFNLPYFCSFFWEADNKKMPAHLRIIIGVFAGLAVCLKPHYALLPIVMEIYLFIKNRNFRYIFRPMNYAIVVVNIIHLAWILLFVPEYIFKIIPMLTVSYHGIMDSFLIQFIATVFYNNGLFILIILVVYSKLPKSEYNKIFYAGCIAAILIAGSENLDSDDQISLLYFFDRLLLIKIILDIWRTRQKKIFAYYQKSFLSMAFIWLSSISVINLYTPQSTKDFFDATRVIMANKLEGKKLMVISEDLFTPLFMYNNEASYNTIITNAFLYGAQNTKLRYEDRTNYKYKLADNAEQYFVNSIIEELTKDKPKLIFINNTAPRMNITANKTCLVHSLEYFMQYNAFRTALNNYEFYDRVITTNEKTANDKKLGKYKYSRVTWDYSVYIRKNPGQAEKPALKFQGMFF
jgi:hypothetical protein